MNQYEAVIQTIEKVGGMATLGQLYKEVLKISDCEWQTKTPLASIRRIVQTRKEIYRIKAGLYGLVSHRPQIEARGIVAETKDNRGSPELLRSDHTYYQGLLLLLGNLRGRKCWSPNQDKGKLFLNRTIDSLRTLKQMPAFSYDRLVHRSSTIDAIWFNKREMPDSFFEVEQSTDIQNSLLKYNDLQDFHARMFIVAHTKRRNEYEAKLNYSAFEDIKSRVKFVDYDRLVKEYEHAVETSQTETVL
jgi:hypothetical protein